MSTGIRRIPPLLATIAVVGLAAIAMGCGGSSADRTTTSTGQSTAPTVTTTAPTASAGQGARGKSPTGKNATPSDFTASAFSDPTTSANQFLPLKPGTQWVRQGFVNVGNRTLPHQVVTTVTDVTKEVDGVRTVAVVDQDMNGGEIAEQSIDWVAEDKQGNVWYLGSYTESYEGGQFVTASDGWLAGANADPGILMLADPQLGVAPYTEDTVPGIEEPIAEIAKTDQSQCVPFKCYDGTLVIQEEDEYKYFAPGVGQIKTEPLSSGGKQEIENLVNLTHLSPSGLSQISNLTLKLDEHARAEAPTVFADSAASKRTA